MSFTSLLSSLQWRTGHRAKILQKRPTSGFVPRLEILEDRSLLSTLTVLNNLDSGAGSLRDAIHSAHSGDTIAFSPSLSGQTITLISGELTIEKDLDIEGPGASQLVVSGNDSSRVFDIRSAANVMIAGLTITHGRVAVNGANQVPGGGAGIRSNGATLTLRNDVLSYNHAIGDERESWVLGGAILSLHHATLNVSDCTFVGNVAIGANGGVGGALVNHSGSTATIVRSAFTDNLARGQDGGKGRGAGYNSDIGLAQGGAITNTDGSLMTVVDSAFTNNRAIGGAGANAGAGAGANGFSYIGIAFGGAISNHDASVLTMTGTTLAGNQCVGGSGITGGKLGNNFVGGAFGGGLLNQGSADVSGCSFDRNEALGGNNNTAGNPLDVLGVAWGGAIRSVGALFGGTGSLTVSNSTFTSNRAIGGRGSAGGTGAEALGAGISVGTWYNPSFITSASIVACVLVGNEAVGGDGGSGGDGGRGLGGGVFGDGQTNLTITRSTIRDNRAAGGAAGPGGFAGVGFGGGAYFGSGAIVCLDAATLAAIFGNFASTSDDDVFGDFTICP